MYHSDLYVKAMTFQSPESIPVTVLPMPALWNKYPEEMREMSSRYPQFFDNPGEILNYDGWTTYHVGTYTDEWGCVWSNIKEGQESMVTGHPVKTREDILKLKIPDDRSGRMPHGFMYLRLLDLRGFEEAMIDFAEEPPELQTLIDKVLEYNLIQTEIAVQKNKERVQVQGDDLGIQTGLAIGREKWVKYLKPCFTAIFGKMRWAGKLVFMHTDGCVYEILPDLREAGADMVEVQYRANGLENLARVCKGKIPINLDLDRQYLPFATPQGIEAHIRECVEALYLPEGGLGIFLYLGDDIRLEIIEAALKALDKYRFYK
jgi:uroporphyrinogen-III decarboxylase